ncbi:MAG: hypothetical protein KKA79_09205 [Nanoarchaeota archaeon]|nr:hypothetical protein [Nanoarchaeota archaeon]MCG2717349.1 hypothetical protein [Nanoarchaeota archaeon]
MENLIPEEERASMAKINLGPPPKELVIADFQELMDTVSLRTSEHSRKLFLMQTIEGHSNMADGAFRVYKDKSMCTRYPNSTLEDIAGMICKNTKKVKEARMQMITDIRDFMQDIIKGKRPKKLKDSRGETLCGDIFFEDYEIKNPNNLLKGFYLGSIMDNYTFWRKLIEKRPYNLEMGGGECVAVDMRKLNQKTLGEMFKCDEALAMELGMKCANGFHLGTLANEEWEDHINVLYNYGVIVDKDIVKSDENIRSAYVRYKRGKGVSDNAAIVMAGKIYGQKDKQEGIEVALGVFLADKVDTIDKFTPEIHKSGLDELLGKEILKSGKVKLTEKEKLNFIFLSAIHPRKKMPDCSQRYFLEVDPQTGDTAIENHLDYLQGKNPKKMFFGNGAPWIRVASEVFYETIEDNFEKYKHLL